MNHLRTFTRAFLGGIMIGVGGTTYLMSPNSMLGAFLFTVGLFTICTFGFALYTGVTGYFLDGKVRENALNIVLIWIGNFAGCFAVAMLLRWGGALGGLAETVATVKLGRPLGYAFCTSILCGALMYIAVDNYRNAAHPFTKYFGMLLCVPAFILSGLEHSVANMFFLAAARGFGVFSREIVLFLLVMTLGNFVGGLGFAQLRRLSAIQKQ